MTSICFIASRRNADRFPWPNLAVSRSKRAMSSSATAKPMVFVLMHPTVPKLHLRCNAHRAGSQRSERGSRRYPRAMAFGGWPEEALTFYEGLEADNSKSYWTSHKAVYESVVLAPMTELLEEVTAELGDVLGGGEPKVFRPYRDIRFSPDKTPYKTHIGATIGHAAYVQFSADGL